MIYQNEVAECGYACLAMVLTWHGRATDVRELSTFRPISSNGVTLADLYDVALEYGLEVEAYQFSAEHLPQIRRGSILHFGGSHFVVFEGASRGYVRIVDPASGRRRIAFDTFVASATGYLLQCSPTPAMPRIRARSKVPDALARIRALNPALRRQTAKVLFVATGCQFAILATPYLGNLVLDHVVASDNLNLLNLLVFTFSGIFAAGVVGQYVQTYLTELIHGTVQMNVTEGLLGHLLRNPIPFFEKRNVGDLFARFRIQDELNLFASRTVISIAIDAVVGVLALALMAVHSPMLTAAALGIFAVYVAVALALFAQMRDTRLLVMEESARCDDALIETIRAATLIKLAGGEVRRTAQYMVRFRAYAAALLQDHRLTACRDALLQFVSYAELLAVTWLAARLMLAGTISVGVFYSFMIYKSLATERLARVINGAFARLMLTVPASRVGDIAEQEPERYTPPAHANRAPETREFESIEMRGVTFRYGVSDRLVLKDASLSIRRGDRIAITGPSGSGKSTVFKLLAAAEPLQHGEITLNGVAWPNLGVNEIRRHVAQMRQGDLILHGSIADNVASFAGRVDDDRVYRVLDEVGLLPDVMSLPMRSRTIISDTIANISAGQRQRLLLARALYEPRELLLLDEPTSNLDPASVARIASLLQRTGRTVVVITHDLALAAHFPRRYQLVDGALAPHDERAACAERHGD